MTSSTPPICSPPHGPGHHQAVAVATGVTATAGERSFASDVGDSEDEVFGGRSCARLKELGLAGVRFDISDQPPGRWPPSAGSSKG
jgi:hypothetical protein